MLMTPNGRWELNKKICLTFTGFHEEMWQPAWGIRTALIGVQAFMGARAEAAVGVGSLDYPEEEREKLAKKSRDWTCPVCQVKNSEILSNEATRKEEQLPDGLTIDPSGGKSEVEVKAEQSSSKAASNQSTPLSAPSQSEDNHHCFGATGPTDALLASIGDSQARLGDSFLNDSTTTSCVTSGPVTPLGDPPSLTKGKQSEVISASSSSSSTSATVIASDLTPTAHTSATARQSPPPRPPLAVNPAPAAIIHQHSTAEPERRLAVLDRAIFTVIFLLLALVLRRVLNAVI
jgi:ubiquitin-conjugating enzyme E2 J1